MIWPVILLSIPLVTIVYYLSYFTLAILLRVSNKHYFLGFGGALFEFKVRVTIFTVGTFIPFFGLARFSKVENFARHRPDYPWQFSDRPWLSRAIATYGGAIGVLVFTMLIVVALKYFEDEPFISREEINKYGVYPSSLAESFGFRRGDRILTINGQHFEHYQELQDPAVYQTSGNSFLIDRKGEKMIIRVPEGDHHLRSGQPFLEIMVPPHIESVQTNSPGEAIGLQRGDRILSVNGIQIDIIDDMRQEFLADADGAVDLRIQRLKGADTLILQHSGVKLDDSRKLGVTTRPVKYTVKESNLKDALRKGMLTVFQLLRGHFYATFEKFKSEDKVREGPITISAALGDNRYWQYLWFYTASFASFCVLWNILPYPRSAFWEVIPLVFEGITRKKYPYALFRSSLKLAWIIFWSVFLFSIAFELMRLF